MICNDAYDFDIDSLGHPVESVAIRSYGAYGLST